MTPKEAFQLKKLFFDIINGYSATNYNGKVCYIKHFGLFDSLNSDSLYEQYYDNAQKKGLSTNEQKLEYLKVNTLWTDTDENTIKDKRVFIDNLKNNRAKLTLLQSQYKAYTEEIDKAENQLLELEYKKNTLLGLTCESFSNRKVNSSNILNSFYIDTTLKTKLFTDNFFDDLDDGDISALILIHNSVTEKFIEKYINKLAIFPLFMRFFGLCDNDPVKFYGKRIIELSFYQEELFYKGCYFKNILSEIKNNVTPEMLENPDELISLYESIKGISSRLENNQGNSARGIMGATREDYIKMGMGDQLGPDLHALAKQKGGKLSIMDIARAHGEIQ